MELYHLNKDNLEEVRLVPFKLEKDIQALVEKNTESIFEFEFIETEFVVEKYRIDTLCFDLENNSFVIVEYKKGSSYSLGVLFVIVVTIFWGFVIYFVWKY